MYDKVIIDKIVSKVNKAECFIILAGETTDISNVVKINNEIILKED